jgi:hypothetical protein
MIVILAALLALAQSHVVTLFYCRILHIRIGGHGGHNPSRHDHHCCHRRIVDVIITVLFACIAAIIALAPCQDTHRSSLTSPGALPGDQRFKNKLIVAIAAVSMS